MRQRQPNPGYLKLLAPYSAEVQKLALAARKLILEEAPEANKFVYEVYTIANHFGFTERPSDAFVFTTTHTKWVNLGFNFGAALPDPAGLLEGDGKIIRHVRIAKPVDLETPGVRELIRVAIAEAERPTGHPSKPRTIVHRAQSARKQSIKSGRAAAGREK